MKNKLKKLMILMLISLWSISSIGQTSNNTTLEKPYISVNLKGDTVINNLPINFIKTANIEHEKYVACQEDLDSCELQRERHLSRSVLYKKDLKSANDEKVILEGIRDDLKRALNISKNNTSDLEKKLNQNIKIRNVLIPFVTATTITSAVMTTMFILKK